MVVGTVAPDGEPHAMRGWACRVVDAATIRLLVDATDEVGVANLAAGGAVAVTAADVRTLRSVQLKGRSSGTEACTGADDARLAMHNDELFTEIAETDHIPRPLLERMVPPAYVACTMTVGDVFDQTPGPGAGAPVETDRR